MIEADTLDFGSGGLIPAVIQDAVTGAVLMLGYMNREALAATLATRRVTFWSRSRGRLWVKGETSGNHLELCSIRADCDRDALLVLARPEGPVCHTGAPTCWGDPPSPPCAPFDFLSRLEGVIRRRASESADESYTARLMAEGTRRIAQKVGEEGVELALAAVAQADADVVGEAADLMYHLLLLLAARNLSLAQVVGELELRHSASTEKR